MDKPIDRLIPVIAQAVNEWMEANDPETVSREVKKLLDRNNEQIVMQLLGFEKNHYENHWKVDRRGFLDKNTTIGKHLQDLQSQAIQHWLAQITLPKLSATAIKKIEKEFLGSYEYALSLAVNKLADSKASEDAEALIQSLVCSDRIEAFIKTMKLVDPQK